MQDFGKSKVIHKLNYALPLVPGLKVTKLIKIRELSKIRSTKRYLFMHIGIIQTHMKCETRARTRKKVVIVVIV
jgi:hypothetical protein